MADMAAVMSALSTRQRVVLATRETRKEQDMSKSKKAAKAEKKTKTQKQNEAVEKRLKKGGKAEVEGAPKVTMTKGEAVSAAMEAVDADKKKRASGLDAAAQVLREAGAPMSAKAMVEAMLSKGLWKTSGKTPEATIYAAIIRDIAAKGTASRFVKTGRGEFAINPSAPQ